MAMAMAMPMVWAVHIQDAHHSEFFFLFSNFLRTFTFKRTQIKVTPAGYNHPSVRYLVNKFSFQMCLSSLQMTVSSIEK